MAADASVLDQNGRVDSLKTGMILYDPFGTGYVNLGQRVGTAWGEGKKIHENHSVSVYRLIPVKRTPVFLVNRNMPPLQ